MFKKVLVPLDGSKLAEKIFPRVEKLVEFCRAEVHLLQVVVSYKIEPQEEKKKEGRSGLTRWALGSVADKVLSCFHVPVMLYRVSKA